MLAFVVGDMLGITTAVVGRAILLPSWAWFTIGTVALFIAMFCAFHKVRAERDEVKGSIDLTIRKLRNIKIPMGSAEKNAADILYKYHGQLVHGIPQYPDALHPNHYPDFYTVSVRLNLLGVIQLEQRQVSIWDEPPSSVGYWVLTPHGIDVFNYLEAQKQASHKEG